jgi:hypothetical protein
MRGVLNPQPLIPLELKRRAFAITTVGSLNKSCGSKVPYKDSIALSTSCRMSIIILQGGLIWGSKMGVQKEVHNGVSKWGP